MFLPFLTEQVRAIVPDAGVVRNASYAVEHGNAMFAFFDAYDRQSLEWFEAVAGKRTADHLFTVVHPPIVPYGARSTWHLYAAERDRPRRTKLLELLGAQHAVVLGGHIHKLPRQLNLWVNSGSGKFPRV